MRSKTIELITVDECSMALLRDSVIKSVMEQSGSCPQAAAGAAVAAQGITISLECWRDQNGRLHCKLTVGWGASA